jgi:hypothetical protein
LGGAGEYNSATKVHQSHVVNYYLKDIIATLRQLHPLPLEHVPPFIFNYQQEHTFIMDKILFTHALTIAPHLSSSGFSRMVNEHL